MASSSRPASERLREVMRRQTHLFALTIGAAAALTALLLLWPFETPTQSEAPDHGTPTPSESGSPPLASDSRQTSSQNPTAPNERQAATIDDDDGGTMESFEVSTNVETVNELVTSTRPHDLALLAAIERTTVDRREPTDAAWRLFALRDEGMSPAILESYTRRYLAHPPRLHAATRDWLETELGPRRPPSAEANSAGGGPRITRFRKVASTQE